MVDTDGRALVIQAHPADVQDRDGAIPPLRASRKSFPFVELAFADCAYNADRVTDATSIAIEIVRRLADQVGFQVLPRRWVVERFFAWINRNRRLAKDFEGTVASAEAFLYAASVMLLKLADEIIEAQRRELAEMRHLIAEVSSGDVIENIYQDPPTEPGTVGDALSNTLISGLSLAPMLEAEAEQVLGAGPRCAFNRSPASDPILWVTEGGDAAAVELNGVLIDLDAAGDKQEPVAEFSTTGLAVTVRPLVEDEEDWRQEAELVFELEQGRTAGYRGFYECDAG